MNKQKHQQKTQNIDAWLRLVRRHPCQPSVLTLLKQDAELEGGDLEVSRKWLASAVTGTSLCPPFLEEALSWHVWRCMTTTINAVKVRLDIFYRDSAGRDFGREEMMPMLLAVVNALREVGIESGCIPTRANDIRVTFVAHSAKRVLPRVGKPPSAENVNGGVTFMADEGVLVYRTEDARKVLVHELLHLHRYDAGLRGNRDVELDVMATFGIALTEDGPRHLGLSECYVDAMACFLQAAWAGRWKRRSHRAALDRHIATAAVRLANHGHVALPWVAPVHPKYTEATHAFSYYICKAALWADLETKVLRAPNEAPPADAAAFASTLIAAVKAWRPSVSSMRAAASDVSLRMTCIE